MKVCPSCVIPVMVSKIEVVAPSSSVKVPILFPATVPVMVVSVSRSAMVIVVVAPSSST